MENLKKCLKAPLVFGFLIFLNACGTLNGDPAMAKPTVPINFSMDLASSSQNGDEMVLTARVTPQIDAPMVRIRVEIPKEVQITQGEKMWSGPLKKGEEKIIQIGVMVSKELNHQIFGFASVEFPDGTKMTKSALVNISSPGGIKQKNGVQPQIRKNRFNEDVIEFPGEVPNQ
ncbi:MAG TPA: hypothetical protein VGB26_09355 [Nitrospiria bacterium]|jgi:hypothetical protein